MKIFICSLVTFATLTGCQKSSLPRSFYWEATDGEKNNLPKFDSNEFKFLPETPLGEDRISFAEQSYLGAKIKGAYVKKIENSEHQIEYLAGYEMPSASPQLKKQIIELEKYKSTIVPDLQRKESRFKDYQYESSPEVVIDFQNENWEALYSITYSDKNRYLWEVLVDKSGLIRKEERLGSHFVDGVAYVFPDSPKHSDIKEVILKDMAGDNSLTSTSVAVLTESSYKAQGENNHFKFSPPQDQFEQVQVYHYIARALEFFKSELGVKIPFQIRALANIGYPEKTNTAFYYGGQIRIGSGDGIVFAKMPLDPSIVMHEAGHALVEVVARLPYQGEGGSINEGFADFYTTTQLKSPYLAEASYQKAAYKRTVANSKTFSEKTGGLYADSLIVSGTLWQIKELIGDKSSLDYSLRVLKRLNPQSDFKFLQKILAEEANVNLNEKEQASVQTVLKQRGWL